MDPEMNHKVVVPFACVITTAPQPQLLSPWGAHETYVDTPQPIGGVNVKLANAFRKDRDLQLFQSVLGALMASVSRYVVADGVELFPVGLF